MDPRYQELATKIMLGHSERIARLFAMLADETDADLLLAMPAQAPDLAAKFDLPQDEVQRRLDDLFHKGLVFTSTRTDPPTYRMSRDLVQFHDASILWPEAPQEFLDLWREFMNEEWYDLAATISKNVTKPFTRIIPVGISVEARQQILDFESVRDIVANADSLAVTKCTCRLSMHNCDRPLENCLQVNRAADYNIARGTGRELTKQEALDILEESEKAGLIHVTINKHDVSHFICNCCPCCCQTMPVLLEKGIYVVDPSRFKAVIDQDECTGCGECHERCYFGAIDWTDGEGSISAIEAEKCIGCGLCTVTCPTEAITMEEVRTPDFVPGAA